MHEEAEGSLEPGVIVYSVYAGYRALQDVLGNHVAEWDDLTPDHVEGWMMAVGAGTLPILDSEDVGGVAWAKIASEMYGAFAQATDNPLSFKDLPTILHLMWEALARHLANMVAYDKTDPEGEIEEHIEKIAGWFSVKVNELGERLINESSSEGQACQASPLALAAEAG